MFKKKTENAVPDVPAQPPWRVLIVDDEPEVHTITRLTLQDTEFQGRRIEFLNAHSAAQARTLLAVEADIALAFVDVVMETDTAGLDLVRHIRNERGNASTRVILRTGQPGMAPERQVIRDFDINDYISKTASTADRLYTATLAALRAYNDITTLERSREQLERYREGLEVVIDATANLFEQRSLRQFASGLLTQLSSMLMGTNEALVVRSNGLTVVQTSSGFEVLAKTGSFDVPEGDPLPVEVQNRLNASLQQAQTIIDGNVYVGYFPTKSGIINLLYVEGIRIANVVDTRLLDIFSKNITIAFENLYLDREILETQAEIIATLGDVVETRSHEAGNHVQRVANLAYMLAQKVGLDEEQCNLVRAASPMHDVGKVAIPDSILLKPGPLDPNEWAHMQQHASIGQQLFGRSKRPTLLAAAVIAGQHHEKFDGSGYPLGLKGEEIHIFARIVALVDVFDALIHKRSYKAPWTLEKVVALLREQSGRHFDPVLVEAFVRNLDEAVLTLRRYPDENALEPALEIGQVS